jgi:four helix bundle protein
MELWVAIYQATQNWPNREFYGLAAQIRDAANSAGSNLAEGVAKYGLREMRRHTSIALGSLGEVAHQLMAAHRVGMLTGEDFLRLVGLQQSAAKLTWLS